jgi:hypothetical protein
MVKKAFFAYLAAEHLHNARLCFCLFKTARSHRAVVEVEADADTGCTSASGSTNLA